MPFSSAVRTPETWSPPRGPGVPVFSTLGPSEMTREHRERLEHSNRLRSSRDYALVKSAGTAFRGRHCIVLALIDPERATQIGFIASKKGVGGAVQRNRARRRLREIVRRRWPRIAHSGYLLAFIAGRTVLTASHDELVHEVEHLLGRVGALSPAGPDASA